MDETTCEFTDISCHWAWMQDEIKGFFVWISEQIFNGMLAVLDTIPVPSWVDNIGGLSSGIPAGVWYFASIADLPFGATVIASAYGIRFIIRRIPIIG